MDAILVVAPTGLPPRDEVLPRYKEADPEEQFWWVGPSGVSRNFGFRVTQNYRPVRPEPALTK